MTPISQQIISTLAALIMLSAFILLAQKKLFSLIHTFVGQSTLMALAISVQAYVSSEHTLYFSAVLTFLLKALFIPWFLFYLAKKLRIKNDISSINAPFYTLIGALLLIVFCYHIISPVSIFPSVIAKNIVVVSMSVMLLGMLMMITRNNAITHVLGFMMMENGLFFAALMATQQGMPMVVELGIAFDLLIAVILFGVFFFHIRSSIESMDVDSLNSLREDL